MDLGDRKIHVCVLERATGEITAEGVIGTGRTDVELFFRDLERARGVMECGGQSPWVSRIVAQHGHEVLENVPGIGVIQAPYLASEIATSLGAAPEARSLQGFRSTPQAPCRAAPSPWAG